MEIFHQQKWGLAADQQKWGLAAEQREAWEF